MTARDRIEFLRDRFEKAQGVNSLPTLLDEVRALESEWTEGDDLDQLRQDIFFAIARMSEEHPSLAQPIILEHLLPLCLRQPEEWRNEMVGWRCDDLLSDWLGALPTVVRYTIREPVLRTLAAHLEGPRAERALRLIGMIGYREESIAARLQSIAEQRSEDIGNVALRALAALGLPPTTRTSILRCWLERTSRATWTQDLIGVAETLADHAVLHRIFDDWLIPANLQTPDGYHNILPRQALAAAGAVAAADPDDAVLQDEVWRRIQNLETANPDLFFRAVMGADDVAQPCDSAEVTRKYLQCLPRTERHRLAYYRLEECDRPRQLLGWSEDPGHAVIHSLLQDATAPTAMQGPYSTEDYRRKLHAWQTTLALGHRDTLYELAPTIENEPNGFVIGAVLELAACFRIDPLPERVRRLIAGDFGTIPNDDAERVACHTAAIAVAHASASKSAFDSLLGFDLIRKGGVLISLFDALTDTAAALVREGNGTVLDRLWHATGPEQPAHRRAAAAAAIGRLIRRNVLQPLPLERIAGLLQDENLDGYARREILHALGYLPAGAFAAEIISAVQAFVEVRQAENHADGRQRGIDFRPVALGVLARQGLLLDSPELPERFLGLRREGSAWHLSLDRRDRLPGAAVIIGILYASDPQAFAPAVADLLRDGDWTTVIQLTPSLRGGVRPAPDVIVDAILSRIRRAGPRFGEPDLTTLLGEIAPERVGRESWSEILQAPPQVRAALADAIGVIPGTIATEKSINLLFVLMGDGQYGVRRAAYRALARRDPRGLLSLCTNWAGLADQHNMDWRFDLRKPAVGCVKGGL
jgi:hypothetical protein